MRPNGLSPTKRLKMAELAVIGSNEFVMGFELIGIKQIFEANTESELKSTLKDVMSNQNVGIIVIDEKSLSKLNEVFRREVENSITPVTVVLSDKDMPQSNLKDLIKKAIGIDLW